MRTPEEEILIYTMCGSTHLIGFHQPIAKNIQINPLWDGTIELALVCAGYVLKWLRSLSPIHNTTYRYTLLWNTNPPIEEVPADWWTNVTFSQIHSFQFQVLNSNKLFKSEKIYAKI